MRLVNHSENNDYESHILDNNDVISTSESLRTVEYSFYTIFDLSPIPMSIGDLETSKIIDVNESFLKVVGFKDKSQVIGKVSTESGLRIVKSKDVNFVRKEIEEKGELKNYLCQFKTTHNNKLNGIFSGTIVELNHKKYLFLMCQVMSPGCIAKCIGKIFKTYLFF